MEEKSTLRKAFSTYLKSLRVAPGKKVSLAKDFHTDYDDKMISKDEGTLILERGLEDISRMQDMLYAHNKYSVLIVLQAMDAAGKDSAIKHVLSGLNPSGVKVANFKVPSSHELDHDYFWRHYKELPGRGEIGIFNRSHYENVLVTKVHPEYILKENLPGINTIKDVDEQFWEKRYKQINRFEKNLAENGTIILKLFLHLSREEQKKRFLERIDNPAKNWKFSVADVHERLYWQTYQQAYEDMLSKTSTSYAPWYVLPADDKWFTRLCLGGIIFFEFQRLGLSYPSVSDEQRKQLLEVRKTLLEEERNLKSGKKKKKSKSSAKK